MIAYIYTTQSFERSMYVHILFLFAGKTWTSQIVEILCYVLIVVQEEEVYHHYQLGAFQDAQRHDLQPDLITYNASMSAPWCGFFHRHEVIRGVVWSGDQMCFGFPFFVLGISRFPLENLFVSALTVRKSSLLNVTNVGVFVVSIGSMYGIIIAYIYHKN